MFHVKYFERTSSIKRKEQLNSSLDCDYFKCSQFRHFIYHAMTQRMPKLLIDCSEAQQ